MTRHAAHRTPSAGFTLVEIIVSIVIMGILATVTAQALTLGAQGFVFSQENLAMTQRAQLALTRASRELLEIIDVTAAGDDSVTFLTTSGTRTIRLSGTTLEILVSEYDTANYYTLMEGVTNTAAQPLLQYGKADGTAWTVADDITDLYLVELTLAMQRTTGETITFDTSVNPRNNGNLNGPGG
jgi:prepilin-type N-terminal cleavage/methylation domain-containing protein